MLKVDRISKDFNGLRALDEVSFEVGKAEIIGLIGPNGSGKSTAFNLITGALPVTSGSVFFNGEDVTKLPAYQVARRGLARTFQLVRPFPHISVLDNVAAGFLFGSKNSHSRREAENQAQDVLEQVGLKAKAGLLAADLTVIERKWLEIGRALAGKPEMLLLDEFMAGLSSNEIPRALELIKSVNARGISVIIVEHIVKAVTSVCQRVIVLNAGMKLAEGSVKDIVSNEKVIEAYLGRRHAHSH
jgi:branched-chain amino acid transport system ATP-binding protein